MAIVLILRGFSSTAITLLPTVRDPIDHKLITGRPSGAQFVKTHLVDRSLVAFCVHLPWAKTLAFQQFYRVRSVPCIVNNFGNLLSLERQPQASQQQGFLEQFGAQFLLSRVACAECSCTGGVPGNGSMGHEVGSLGMRAVGLPAAQRLARLRRDLCVGTSSESFHGVAK